MATPFPRTLRSLEAIRTSWWPVALVLAVLAAGWGWWAVSSQVGLVLRSERARLESRQQLWALEAPSAGQLESSHLTHARRVERGEVLGRLRSSEIELEVQAQRSMLRVLEQVERPALDGQIELVGALVDGGAVSRAKLAEGRAQLEEARAQLEFARAESGRLDELLRSGVTTPAARDEARARVRRLEQVERRWESTLGRLRGERTEQRTELRARLAELERERARLDRDVERLNAQIARLTQQLDRQSLRALCDGMLTLERPYTPGVVLERGERLGVIVPDGPVIVVAMMDPARAQGRVTPGQPAQLRLEAYPWVQYGALEATVSAVAAEPVILEGTQGRRGLRVELELEPGAPARMRRHGLVGVVEIEIARVSPAALMLRSIGRALEDLDDGEAP